MIDGTPIDLETLRRRALAAGHLTLAQRAAAAEAEADRERVGALEVRFVLPLDWLSPGLKTLALTRRLACSQIAGRVVVAGRTERDAKGRVCLTGIRLCPPFGLRRGVDY